MPLREGDHLYATLGLTQNFEEALAYLGYDPDRYRQGFTSLEEIFKYVVSTPFFNKNRYLLENRNNVSRTRDRKRKTYTEFLKWIADRTDLPEYPEAPSFEQSLERAVSWFPHVANEYAQAQQKLQRQRDVKARFSGEVAAALTGFEGKQLGYFMKNFRNSFATPEDYDNFVLTSNDTELYQKVQMVKLSVS